MIVVVTWENKDQYHHYIEQSYKLRHEVFNKRLGWDVQSHGDKELDYFDMLPGTVYVLHVNELDQVNACARLLPTTGPNMLKDIFPILMDNKEPICSPRVWESTRFAVDLSNTPKNEIGSVTANMLDGICEVGLAYNLDYIITVTDMAVARILKRCGMNATALGSVHQIGSVKAVAGKFEPSEENLKLLRSQSNITSSRIVSAPWIKQAS